MTVRSPRAVLPLSQATLMPYVPALACWGTVNWPTTISLWVLGFRWNSPAPSAFASPTPRPFLPQARVFTVTVVPGDADDG